MKTSRTHSDVFKNIDGTLKESSVFFYIGSWLVIDFTLINGHLYRLPARLWLFAIAAIFSSSLQFFETLPIYFLQTDLKHIFLSISLDLMRSHCLCV